MDKPTTIYAEVLEPTALEQFRSAMEQDFAVQGALMPDAHTGYSLPIGAVVATQGVVVPAWVGYDIGCGMCALPLGVTAEELTVRREEIFSRIYEAIPVGHNINAAESDVDMAGLSREGRQVAETKKAGRALGSLGGGNHFIELGADENGSAWAVIHSGSRGVGYGIATFYMKAAHPEGKAKEGHYGLRTETECGQAYLNDQKWALEFALQNRLEMMRRITDIVGGSPDWGRLINRNHNHAVKREGLWLHRKGATHAEAGMDGVIPGNMRDGSFIVRGKGNKDALWSSSHGAGRVLGRKQAKRELTMEQFSHAMTGITARVEEATLDESPFAYKDIFDVMALQSELVDVVAHVSPIINIKG